MLSKSMAFLAGFLSVISCIEKILRYVFGDSVSAGDADEAAHNEVIQVKASEEALGYLAEIGM